jgi:hypothetical protein
MRLPPQRLYTCPAIAILFIVLPPHKQYFIFVISILKGEIIYLPKWHGASLQTVTSECKARNNKLAVEFQLKAAILTSY